MEDQALVIGQDVWRVTVVGDTAVERAFHAAQAEPSPDRWGIVVASHPDLFEPMEQAASEVCHGVTDWRRGLLKSARGLLGGIRGTGLDAVVRTLAFEACRVAGGSREKELAFAVKDERLLEELTAWRGFDRPGVELGEISYHGELIVVSARPGRSTWPFGR